MEPHRRDHTRYSYQERKPRYPPSSFLTSQKVAITLQVFNLPHAMLYQDIKTLFEGYGTVNDMRMIKRGGQFKGLALIRFSSLNDAEKAIQDLKGQTLPGSERPVHIKWLDSEEKRLKVQENGTHKLFVGNLPRGVSEKSLYELFGVFGKIESLIFNEVKFWALVGYEKKESAILARKNFDKQAYLHGAKVPIDVRFKEKKYNFYMTKKQEIIESNPFSHIFDGHYHKLEDEDQCYYYSYKTKKSSFHEPQPGSKVYVNNNNGAENFYIVQDKHSINDLNYNNKFQYGPPGANLYLSDLPTTLRESDLEKIFAEFGKIVHLRVMTECGKSRGIGFVNYSSPSSAQKAIAKLNHSSLRDKRIRVEPNRRDINKDKNDTSHK